MENSYLHSVKKQFAYYKTLGENAIAQLSDAQLFLSPNAESNSIAIIINHLSGNMLSRFTAFLTEDGEKPWRNREAEFADTSATRHETIQRWQQGWDCLFNALDDLTVDQLEQVIYIRNEGHTVIEALNRQLAHYSYHIGQIVYVAKMYADREWKSLSIPKNGSDKYNETKFAQERGRRHFTDNV